MPSASRGPSGASLTWTSPSSSTATPPALQATSGPKAGSPHGPDDRLGPRRRHPLDVEALHRRRPGDLQLAGDLARAAGDRRRPFEPQAHASGVALVDEPGRHGLQGDRSAELRRGAPGRAGGGDEPPGDDRDAPAAQQAFDVVGRQPASPLPKPLGDDRRRCGGLGVDRSNGGSAGAERRRAYRAAWASARTASSGEVKRGTAPVCKDGPVFRWDVVEALLRVREL